MIVTLVLTLLGTALLLTQWCLERRRLAPGVRRLPGPRGLPFIGCVHDIPSKASWIKFYEWSKQYGPIYQMEIFGTVHVWISTADVAHDLLSKRGAIYSDRPMIPNLPDNRTSGDYLALLGHTDTHTRQRKVCNNLMLASNRASLHGYPTVERDRFLYLLYRDPASYIEWIEQFTSRTVSRLSWGTAQPAQVLRHTTFGLLETISPAGSLPNVVSFLRHMPAWLSPWKKKERARHALEDRLFHANVDFVSASMAGDRAQPSFIHTFLETKESADERVRARWSETAEGMHVVGLMAIAGALTIGSPIQSFLLAMCHHPEWQRKLQAELDTVLGGRCPQWEDRERLPLLRAVVKEVIRWRPPVPTGIPHAVEKNDVYNGYHIPAGATIHALEWGISREETRYPDPDTFNPGRWLDPCSPTYREPLSQHPSLAGFSQFGWGRRTCQGVPIVEQDLFLTMGGIAWGLTIQKRRDPATGAEVPVHRDDYTPLLIAKPAPFLFDAVPRSRDKVVQMRAMYRAARDPRNGGEEHGDMDVGQFEQDLGGRIWSDGSAGVGADDAADDAAVQDAAELHAGREPDVPELDVPELKEPLASEAAARTADWEPELPELDEPLAGVGGEEVKVWGLPPRTWMSRWAWGSGRSIWAGDGSDQASLRHMQLGGSGLILGHALT